MKTKNILQNSKGITLVALIITIIVLIILAAVTIKTLFDVGFIDTAQASAEKYQEEQYKELDMFSSLDNKLEDVTDIIDNIQATSLELSTEKDLGKYIDYDAGTLKTYNVDTNLSGYIGTQNQDFETEDLRWRIWKIENNNLYLISELPTEKELYLTGYQGYNNGVYLLDNICKACYANTEKYGSSITAQNLKIEDIESVTTYDYKSYNNGVATYGSKLENPYASTSKYPKLWLDHDNKYPSAEKSSPYGPYTQTEELSGDENTIIHPYMSFWEHTYRTINNEWKTPIHYQLVIRPNEAREQYTSYWLSSRSVYLANSDCGYGLQYVSPSGVFGYDIYYSDGGSETYSGSVRPIVCIPLSNCIISESENEEFDYHIAPRFSNTK